MPHAFAPSRSAALDRLSRFAPRAGAAYGERRNFDLGPGAHDHVSGLSPYIRHRVLSDEEVLRAVLARHDRSAAGKFIQEVVWRSYWKGWLDMRPAVWTQYRAGLRGAIDAVQTQSGLRARWQAACTGDTGIDGFDDWAGELVQTGYLHNHARLWFASIWVFTLRLPWELGADFFLRHLLDGDPASNTLGWRWVAGLQTPGKTYVADPDNIARFTGGRFRPQGLAREVTALTGPPAPDPQTLPVQVTPDPDLRTGLLLHPDDLTPEWMLDRMPPPESVAIVSHRTTLSPLAMAPEVLDFETALMADMCDRLAPRLGPISRIDDFAAWVRAERLEQIVAPYAPVGPEADALAASGSVPIVTIRRHWDETAWPHATHGFFRFRKQIPVLLDRFT